MKILIWGMLLFLPAGECLAQQDSTRTMELQNLVIHGNRLDIHFRESSRNINIISRKEIQTLPAQSLPEILSYVPGVDIRQRGPLGVQSDISIRGGSFEQTLVLINGIKLTDPQTGHHSMNVPVNISNVDRIEVLKGPGARIYGQNAFSGAVNFITRIPEKKYAGIRLSGGQNGLFGGSIDVSLPGKFGNYISISRDVSDGYRHNTDFSINNLFYQSSIDLNGENLEILGGLANRKFGANGFYASPAFTEQYEEVTSSILSLGYKRKIRKITIAPRIYWRSNRDNYFFVRDQPEIYENLHYTHVGAAELNSSWDNSLGHSGFGIEYRYESIAGDWVRNGEQTSSNLDGFSRQNVGIFLEHQFNLFNIDITPGVYFNFNADFGFNVFPGIDLGYFISPSLRIYGNMGKTYRIPTFYDMYYQSPVEQGNPDLDPEEALSYEAGIRYLNVYMQAEVSLFHQNAGELIDWIAIPQTDSTFIWTAANFSNVRRNGIEIAYFLDMEEILNTNSYINHFRISYNFIESDLQEKAITSRYVLENLKHQLILGLEHKIIWKVYHHFQARYNQRVSEPSYWVLDSRIFWSNPKGHLVYLEATNLTNTQYTEVMTPMPGRWFRAGLSYQIAFK
ncbi:MAG: TonB-dependent receptor [Cyclobacteriaceae bacterium]|nr:TonB-dependent receptor [Cyclobacteriaceae bacterium]